LQSEKSCRARLRADLAVRASLSAGIAAAGLAFGGAAWACATCGCTLTKDWLGPQAGNVSGWSAAASFDVIDQNRLRAGKTNLDLAGAQAILNPGSNTGNEVELQTLTRTTTLQADYGSADWGVSIQVPFVYRYHTTYQDGTPAGYNFNQFNALGDARVMARYAGFSRDESTGLLFGIKLPTGSTTEPFNGDLGGTVDPSLQPGTGSTDVLLGGYYAGQDERLGWFAQGLWQHALASQYGYTPGDALTLNLGLRYAEMGQALTPLLQLNLIHRNTDSGVNASTSFDGTPLTGGNLAYLAPGVSWLIGSGFSAFGYVQVPVYQDVKGVQLTPRYIFSTGIRKAF
jgi:hypothetical protein